MRKSNGKPKIVTGDIVLVRILSIFLTMPAHYLVLRRHSVFSRRRSKQMRKVVLWETLLILPPTDNEREQILRWLAADEQAFKYRDHLEKRVEGTGEWLLQHESYLKWKNEFGEILWLSGIGELSDIFVRLKLTVCTAGCGKSVMW